MLGRYRFIDTKLVPLTDDWFNWLDYWMGKERLQCSMHVYAHVDIVITINTPEYIMLYEYYLINVAGVKFERI